MAAYSGNVAVTTTALTANTVDTVILTAPTLHGVTVLNSTGTSDIYFTVCNVGGPDTQPTVAGTDCYHLPAAIGSLDVEIISLDGVVVNLISSGTPGYSVEIV